MAKFPFFRIGIFLEGLKLLFESKIVVLFNFKIIKICPRKLYSTISKNSMMSIKYLCSQQLYSSFDINLDYAITIPYTYSITIIDSDTYITSLATQALCQLCGLPTVHNLRSTTSISSWYTASVSIEIRVKKAELCCFCSSKSPVN